MELFRVCSKCKNKIKVGKACPICNKEKKPFWLKRKKNKNTESYKKHNSFYNDKRWIKLRKVIMHKYNAIDLVDYYINKKITEAKHIHHIIPIMENSELAFNEDNLIPLSELNHQKVHKLYSKNAKVKKNTQDMLRGLISRFKNDGGFNPD